MCPLGQAIFRFVAGWDSIFPESAQAQLLRRILVLIGD